MADESNTDSRLTDADIALAKFLADHKNKTIGGITQMFKAAWDARDEEVARLNEQLRDALKLNQERSRCLDLEMQENKRLREALEEIADQGYWSSETSRETALTLLDEYCTTARAALKKAVVDE